MHTEKRRSKGRSIISQWGYITFIAISVFYISVASNAHAHVLRLSDSHNNINLFRYTQVLEDRESTLKFLDVRNHASYQPIEKSTFGFSHSTYWIKLEVVNQTKTEDWILEKAFANTHEFDLYLQDKNGNYQLTRGGVLNLIKSNGYRHRKPLFYLNIPSNKRSVIFIRYKSKASINFDMTLWPKKTFDIEIQKTYFGYGITYGIFLLLAIGSIAMLIKRWDYMQFTALSFSILSLLAINIFDGTLLSLNTAMFWPFQRYFLYVIVTSLITAPLLAARFILTSSNAPDIHKKIIDTTVVVLFAIGFSTFFFHPKLYALLSPTPTAIVIAYLLYALIAFYKDIPITSKILVSVMLVNICTVLIQMIFTIGIFSTNFDISDYTRIIITYGSLTSIAIYLVYFVLDGTAPNTIYSDKLYNLDLDTLFSKSSTFIAILDSEGKVKTTNYKYPFANVNKQDFIEQHFHLPPEINPNEDQRITIEECIENAKNNLPSDIDLSIKGSNDEEEWISFSFSPQTDKKNNVEVIVIEGRDITDQKRAELTIRKLAQGGSIHNIEAALHYLVKELSALLNVKYAFIGEYDKGQPNAIRTRVMCQEGLILENISYNVHDTASQNVIDAEFCIIPCDARSVYPNDELLHRYNIESYIGTPLIDSKGKMLGILCLLHDKPITPQGRIDDILHIFANRIASEIERTNIENQTLNATEKLSFHIQNSPLAYIECDKEFKVVGWNPAAQRLFGYHENEVLRKPVSHFIFDEPSQAEQNKTIRSIMANLHGRFTRTKNINKRGDKLTCEWHNTMLLNPSGEFVGVSSIIVDITAEEEALQFIKNKEIEQRETLDSLNDSVMIFDLDGQIISTNKATSQLFGYQPTEIIGCHIQVLIPDYPIHYSPSNTRERLCTDLETNAKTASGNYIPISLTINSLPISDNKAPRFIGIFRDLSAIKLQQEQLRRSQKMEALGKLTGGIAHDFNNILGVITGYTDLLKVTTNDEKITRYATEIRHASNRGAKLTTKLLAFSSKHSSNHQIININELLKDNQHMLERTLTAKITFNYALEENLWLVDTDSNELEDAILNLAINAMHAIHDSGSVSFSTENITLSDDDAHSLSLSPGDYVVLSIADNGEGIPQEIVDKIFDPFFTTKGDSGTGLGLSQVYGFMDRNHGRIVVDSKIGLGTLFSLYFPRTLKASSPPKTTSTVSETNSASHKNVRVLAVDDDIAMLSMLEELLKLNGFSVMSTTKSTEALHVLSENAVDILVSDIMMPEMNGYELANHVRAKYPHIKIQLVSGYVNDEKGLHQGHPLTAALIRKPYNANTLIKKLEELIEE